jgi:hypothetical protein
VIWFCLASGPSMTQEDADAVCGVGKVIAIGNTISLAPWADVLYSCDAAWWHTYAALHVTFAGRKVALEQARLPFDVEGIPFGTGAGLGTSSVNTGNNSGYQAINLAFLEGATTIVLLGYDMQHTGGRHHWHADHPRHLGNFNRGMPELCAPKFAALARDLRERGVAVINASRETALTCFDRLTLAETLRQL